MSRNGPPDPVLTIATVGIFQSAGPVAGLAWAEDRVRFVERMKP